MITDVGTDTAVPAVTGVPGCHVIVDSSANVAQRKLNPKNVILCKRMKTSWFRVSNALMHEGKNYFISLIFLFKEYFTIS